METTLKSMKWLIDKDNIVCSYNGMLFGNKKKWSTDIWYNIDEIWKYVKWKKLHIEWFHLHDMYRTGKSIKTENISGCTGLVIAWVRVSFGGDEVV